MEKRARSFDQRQDDRHIDAAHPRHRGAVRHPNIVNTSRVFDEQAQRQRESFVTSLQKRGSVQTKDLVQASRNAILQNDYTTLQSFVPEIAKDDPEVAYVFVADKEGSVLAHSDREAQQQADHRRARPRSCSPPRTPSPKRFRRRRASSTCSRGRSSRTASARAPSCSPTRCQLLENMLKKLDADKEAALPGRVDSHRARRPLLRARRHRAGDLPGAAHLAPASRCSRGAPIRSPAAISRRASRSRRATRSACSARTSTTWPTGCSILMRETAEKATLEKELEVARTIQETLVPPRDLVERARSSASPATSCRRRSAAATGGRCTTCPTGACSSSSATSPATACRRR